MDVLLELWASEVFELWRAGQQALAAAGSSSERRGGGGGEGLCQRIAGNTNENILDSGRRRIARRKGARNWEMVFE